MQVIAGIHFNFSLPDSFWVAFQQMEGDRRSLQEFRSESYFGLIRNLQRFGWLILYLFGASPAVQVVSRRQATSLTEFDEHTCYGPYATSLRMSNIGYTNRSEEEKRRQRVLQLAARIHRQPDPGDGDAVAALPTDRGESRRRLPPAQCQRPANRKQYYTSMRPKQPPQGEKADRGAAAAQGGLCPNCVRWTSTRWSRWA